MTKSYLEKVSPRSKRMPSSSSYLRLETRGRRTGLPHPVELRYIMSQGHFFVIPGRSGSDWFLNALAAGTAKVRLGDLLYDAVAQGATEPEFAAALTAFARKYGARVVRDWYHASRACLRLSPTGPPARRGIVQGESNVTTTVAQWVTKKTDYYGDVAAAFDSASEEYDFTISRNFINTWIRRRSIGVLRRYIRSEDILLEIGSGTGAEAMEVSRYVSGIVATDISRSMIDLLSMKVRAKRLGAKVVPLVLGASEISKAKALIGDMGIRVAYSFNGALNCEPRMGRFVRELHSLLEPSGYFICSIRNTVCASEMLSHALVLQFSKATPRKRQPIMVSVGGRDIPSTYFSPSRFAGFFKSLFVLREAIALPALLPPAYLSDYYLKFRSRMPLLEKLDPLLSGKFPFNQFGDQTLFVLQKV
ncbi:MAG: methyltransferase domain-containing protein [Thaumarchaeota archaeon]|nr:methyltransferase domain-containing protein [Nitrososphaerota archaeon]